MRTTRSVMTRLALITAAVTLLLTGCTPSAPASTTSPATSPATPSTIPTATATKSPTPTPTPEPTYTPLPPAEGEDPTTAVDWTTQLVYDTCVGAPDADPSNPITVYSPIESSRVDQSGPGVWLVVIPVTRAVSGTDTAGQQVCFIDGTPENPNVSVAASL